ncbi:hypothetical protein GOQ29_03000 [Clostridium sp. D2Q-14]|uniref:hypothetical protein n=1 Tax=Anaeromonas gelatinilytica TaxID=2683194 RepID=UPI00193C1AA1|nr:hypothetical protein [Anaeromonas gelatinilytica]MBS4534578.1 hypothetical protein [Anaeromonas gelatinilytica]
MSLLKNNSYLLTDSFNNIYHILNKENKLIVVNYNKIYGSNNEKILMDNCSEYFFATIDKTNNINLICQELNKNNIYLFTCNSGQWSKLIIDEEEKQKIYEPMIIQKGRDSHIFYLKKDNVGIDTYNFIHKVISGEKVLGNNLFDVKSNGILNPYSINKYKNGILITYINSEEYYHNICLRYFDMISNEINDEIIINDDEYEKYYLDSIVVNDNILYITYCGKEYGNFKVICDYLDLQNSILETNSRVILSNPSNCIYPTLVYDKGDLWVIWYEYQGIMSSVKLRNSKAFTGPYLWNKSKGKNLLRYGFISNNDNMKKRYKLNYSFGLAPPDISFIGFGDLDDVQEVVLKKNLIDRRNNENMTEKKNEEYVEPEKCFEDEPKEEEIEEYKKDIEENKRLLSKLLQSTVKEKDMFEDLTKKIKDLEEKVKTTSKLDKDEDYEELERRVQDIEDYLTRRRRGIFGPRG